MNGSYQVLVAAPAIPDMSLRANAGTLQIVHASQGTADIHGRKDHAG